jgi:methylated-DNA-[protein]-cysteine S-methyltransferase
MKASCATRAPAGVSGFAQRVYRVVRRIPEGRVSTYARVAAAIGCRCPRAVGAALRVNPFTPQVPCHRVISSDLTPGGFRGCREGADVREKIRRLACEGVAFKGGKLAQPERLWPGGHKHETKRSLGAVRGDGRLARRDGL